MTSPTLAPSFYDNGNVAGGGTVAVDLSKASYHRITMTGTTLTLGAPNMGTRPMPTGDVIVAAGGPSGPEVGAHLFIEIRATGGAATVTFNAAFKIPTGAGSIASGQRRLFTCVWDGANWLVIAGATDIPN
jgi:hypothetical protein